MNRRVASSATKRGRAHDERLYEALSELVRVFQFRDRQRVCYYDISVTQCYALQDIIHGRSARAQDIAASLKLDKSTTSRALAGLARSGYIRQETDPRDRRATLLVATPKGRALHDRIERDLVRQYGQAIADLTALQRETVITVLKRLGHDAGRRFGLGKRPQD